MLKLLKESLEPSAQDHLIVKIQQFLNVENGSFDLQFLQNPLNIFQSSDGGGPRQFLRISLSSRTSVNLDWIEGRSLEGLKASQRFRPKGEIAVFFQDIE